jgi:replicative DNA helicase
MRKKEPVHPEGRVPPYSQEAEAAVLGSILLDNSVLQEVESIVTEEDFYVETHKRIYKSMLSLNRLHVGIDHVTLGTELRRLGDLEKVGGAMALANLTDAVVTSVRAKEYSNIVHEKAARRRVIYKAQEIVADGFREDKELDNHIDEIVTAAIQLSRTQMPDSLPGRGENVLRTYEKVASGYRGVPMPWKSLSNMTAGMWPKTVTIVVGRPATGKSSCVVLMGRHAWQNNYPTLIVSPEMSKDELAERFFVNETGVSYLDIIAGTLSDHQLPKLVKSVEDLKDAQGIWIMDSEDDLSARGIERAIRACKPKFVAVDSMYKLDFKGDKADRLVQSLSWLEKSAKKYDFAAVGFAQQNREAEKSEKHGGGARLGTIALSDDMGQDPHAVFALEQTIDMKADNKMRIHILKIRRGKWTRRYIDANWNFDTNDYSEIEEQEEEYSDKDAAYEF